MGRMVDIGEDFPEVFDRVFIARSGSWTPPWLDPQFERFIAGAPRRQVKFDEPHWDIVRDWDEEEVEKYKAAVADVMARHEAGAR